MVITKSQAQIVYTDIDPDSIVGASVSQVILSYFIDLDNDANYEFELRHFNPGPGNEAVELHGETIGMNEVIVDAIGHAKVISEGDTIGPGSTIWGNDNFGILDVPWYGGGDKYFGFRFRISGSWHYAWARVNIPADRLYFTIKDFAYNNAIDELITAGMGISGGNTEILSPNKNELSVNPNPVLYEATIEYRTHSNKIKLNLFNINGLEIEFKYRIEEDRIMFDTNKLGPGLYFIRLNGDNGKSYYGKFIVPQ